MTQLRRETCSSCGSANIGEQANCLICGARLPVPEPVASPAEPATPGAAAQARFCTNCGAPRAEGRFCTNCGTPFTD